MSDNPYNQQYRPEEANVPLRQGEAKFSERSPYRDLPWAIIFVLHVFGIIGLAVYFGHKYENKGEGQAGFVSPGKSFYELLAICVAGGLSSAALWLVLIRNFANCLVWFTLFLGVAFNGVFAVISFAAGFVVMGVIAGIFVLLQLLYIYLVRDRIAFAAAMLEIVSGAIAAFPATYVVALGFAVLQAVWAITWVISASFTLNALAQNTSTSNAKDNSGLYSLLYFVLLVSLYWGAQVIKNIVHVSIAGTVATWYFMYPSNMPSNPTLKAVKRSVTTSFGSICFGSFIIAVVQAVRAMVRQALRSQNSTLRCLADCILACLENMLNYFNLYAFTQVAIYGKSYCEAAKDTWELFSAKGFDAVINDNMIGGVLVFGSLIGAALVGGVGFAAAKYVVKVPNDDVYAWMTVAFVIGFILTILAMEAIQSGVACVFVCYAEDPNALNSSKPEVYAKLTTAWRARYPNFQA